MNMFHHDNDHDENHAGLPTRWKNNNVDILLLCKVIKLVNKILILKSVPLFYFILKWGLIKIMCGLIEIPILEKKISTNTKHLILL